MFKTIQLRYTFIAVSIILLASLLTIAGIRAFVAPALKTNEEQLMLDKVNEITSTILLELKKLKLSLVVLRRPLRYSTATQSTQSYRNLSTNMAMPKYLVGAFGRYHSAVLNLQNTVLFGTAMQMERWL